MHAMFVIIGLMFLILVVAVLLLRDKDDISKHKDLIIPVQGTRFKSNI